MLHAKKVTLLGVFNLIISKSRQDIKKSCESPYYTFPVDVDSNVTVIVWTFGLFILFMGIATFIVSFCGFLLACLLGGILF